MGTSAAAGEPDKNSFAALTLAEYFWVYDTQKREEGKMKPYLLWFVGASKVLAVLFLIAALSGQNTTAQTCRLKGFDPGSNAVACTDPSLRAVYGDRECTVLDLSQKIIWEPKSERLVVQCYRGGQLINEFGRDVGAASGSNTIGQCTGNTVGEHEIKLWLPNASSPCDASPFKAANCSESKLSIGNIVAFDTPVTWTNSECPLTLQGYEGGRLVGQFKSAASGKVTIGQLSTRTARNLEVKAWIPDASQPLDSKMVEVQDCRSTKFTIATILDLDRPLTWALDNCVGTVQAYQGGRLVGEVQDAASGMVKTRNIVPTPGLTELKYWPKGASQPSHSRYVEVTERPAPLSSFLDDFEIDRGWLQGVSEEIVNVNAECYDTGISEVLLSTNVKHSGLSSLRVTANQEGTTQSDHVIVGNELLDAGQKGKIGFRVKVLLPSSTADSGQTGPEISIQNTLTSQEGGTSTFVAALQHLTNPFEEQSRRNGWAIWTSERSGQPPGWVIIANRELKRDQWYTIELLADFDTNTYTRFSVVGDGLNWAVPLQSRNIRPESRDFQPAFVVTLEAENLSSCNSPQVTKNTVYYDDVELFRPWAIACGDGRVDAILDNFDSPWVLCPGCKAHPSIPDPILSIVPGCNGNAMAVDYDLRDVSPPSPNPVNPGQSWVVLQRSLSLDLSKYTHLRLAMRGSNVNSHDTVEVKLKDAADQLHPTSLKSMTDLPVWRSIYIDLREFGTLDLANITGLEVAIVRCVDCEVFDNPDVRPAEQHIGTLYLDELAAVDLRPGAANRLVETVFERPIPDSAVRANAANALLARISRSDPGTDFVPAWFPQTDPNFDTYVQAEALLVFTYEYERTGNVTFREAARRIAAKLISLQIRSDRIHSGAWYSTRIIQGNELLPPNRSIPNTQRCDGNETMVPDPKSGQLVATNIDTCEWVGNVGWVLIALGKLQRSGFYDNPTALRDALDRGAAWVAGQSQYRGDTDYPNLISLGIEGNVSAYFGLLAAGKKDEAASLGNAISQFGWDPVQRRMKPGVRPEDAATAIDVSGSWGVTFLRSIGKNQEALDSQAYSASILRVCSFDGSICGYGDIAGPYTPAVEFTAQAVSAGIKGADFAMQQICRLQIPNGGLYPGAFPGALDHWYGGPLAPWNTTMAGVSPTAWVYFALYKDPLLEMVEPTPVASLYFPRLATGEFTGIALVNLGSTTAFLRATAYGASGALVARTGVYLAPRAQLALIDNQLLGSGFEAWRPTGWVRIESSAPEVQGFFLSFDESLWVLDGADVSARTTTDFILPEIEDPPGFTQVHIANPSSANVTVTLQLIDSQGQSVGNAASRTIAANGTLVDTVSSLFPQASAKGGMYVLGHSTVGVVPFEYLGRFGKFVEGLNGQDTSQGRRVIYSPQYVVGDNYRTTLSIVNLEAIQTSVVLRLFDDNGRLLSAPPSIQLAPRGKIQITAQNFFVEPPASSLVQGWVEITSDRPTVGGAVVFGDLARMTFSSALPLSGKTQNTAIFGQVASDQNWFTGLAVLNAGSTSASFTLEVFDNEGKLVSSRTDMLAAQHRVSGLLTQFFPSLPNLSGGYLKVRSVSELISFGLFGTNSLSVLSAVPPQPFP